MSALRLKKFLLSHWLLIICLIFFSSVTLYQVKAVSYSGDEELDLYITDCLVRSLDPFSCPINPSQSRLAYYIHAAIAISAHDIDTPWHYYFSSLVGLSTILIVYRFSRSQFQPQVANMTILLMATSIPLIAGSRLLLSHSNILLTFFQTLSFIYLYYYFHNLKLRQLVISAACWGLAVSSSLLGLFSWPFYVAVIAIALFKQGRVAVTKIFLTTILFSTIAAVAFFLSSPFYLIPENIGLTFLDIKYGTGYWYWNYLSLHLLKSPFYFSALTYILKVGPWWALPFLIISPLVWWKLIPKSLISSRAFFLCFYCLLFFFFFLKSVVFRYEAPHHQIHLYPFMYISLSLMFSVLARRLKKIVVTFFMLALALSVLDVVTFFPEYLFYGAQYGRQFIGEIYGPAVLLCQDQNPIYTVITELQKKGEVVVTGERSCLRLRGNNAVQWQAALSTVRGHKYYYAYVDYLHHSHLATPPDSAYYNYVFHVCTPYYEEKFPTGLTIYALYKCPATTQTPGL